jgi:hypothetical protein
MTALANGIARCNGIPHGCDGWRQNCETCLRRTAPRPIQCWMTAPPTFIDNQCPYAIKPKETKP